MLDCMNCSCEYSSYIEKALHENTVLVSLKHAKAVESVEKGMYDLDFLTKITLKTSPNLKHIDIHDSPKLCSYRKDKV